MPAHIRDSDQPLQTMAPERVSRNRSARIRYTQADIERVMAVTAARKRKPRNTWHQPGWSDVSPHYRTMATIDSRWSK